jgi:large subunit ribosomal protein L13
MKTFSPTPKDITRDWVVVDAKDKVLGRLATAIAHRLRGKHKPEFAPHVDNGDFVVVVNAEKVVVTGRKLDQKMYHKHSNHPGHLKSRTLKDMMTRSPETVIRLAVAGMLPKSRLARKLITKLKIYVGSEHPHAAQQPKVLDVQ